MQRLVCQMRIRQCHLGHQARQECKLDLLSSRSQPPTPLVIQCPEKSSKTLSPETNNLTSLITIQTTTLRSIAMRMRGLGHTPPREMKRPRLDLIRMCIARLMRMTSQSQFSGPLNRTSNSPPCRIWGSPLTTPGETLSQRLRMTPSGLCRCTQSQGIEKRSLKESCPSSQECLIRRYQCARAVSARVSTRTHSPSLSGLSRPGCLRRL